MSDIKSFTIGNGLTMWDQDQYEHFQRVCIILSKFHMYFDLSLMGTGKTFIACAVCIKYNIPLFVVCPVSSIHMWNEVAEMYDIEIIEITSFAKIRGHGSTRQLKHPYLNKTVLDSSYTATPHFQDLCSRGIMLVIDEGQNIKNSGQQSRAVQALCDTVRATTTSRFAVLSASLIDKQPMAITMLRTIGFFGSKSDRLYYYNVGTRKHDYTGYKEIVANCETIDAVTTRQLMLPFLPTCAHPGSTLKLIQSNVFSLFTKVVLEQCASSMADPDLPSDLKNGFYWIHNLAMRDIALQAKNRIQRATGYAVSSITGKGTVDWQKRSMDVVVKSLRLYETALLEICVRETLRWTTINPRGKVIIFTNFTRPLQLLHTELKHLGAIMFYGKLKPEERRDVQQRFQTDSSCRVFIGNMQAGGMSLNLHDTSKDGQEPRLVLILPTYKMMDIYQATGRAVRRGMTSEAVVRIVYSRDHPLDSVFDAIARKSTVLEEVNNRTHGAKRLYPGQFERWEDGDQQLPPAVALWNKRQRLNAFQEALVDAEPEDDSMD